jgi:hypothetical protein
LKQVLEIFSHEIHTILNYNRQILNKILVKKFLTVLFLGLIFCKKLPYVRIGNEAPQGLLKGYKGLKPFQILLRAIKNGLFRVFSEDLGPFIQRHGGDLVLSLVPSSIARFEPCYRVLVQVASDIARQNN